MDDAATEPLETADEQLSIAIARVRHHAMKILEIDA
jgi:hypothetical protein